MAQPYDHLSGLNRHIEALEEKVIKLRASLEHWQKWLWEYCALKEEVENLPTDPFPTKDLRRIRRDFEGDLLTKQEINEIFGKTDLKSPENIVSVLGNRVDYVERNIATLEKLLDAEETKLAQATVVANPDGGLDEETGLPITDIIEDLDEDGNVTGFHLQTGADAEPKILDALKRAGIDDIPEGGQEEEKGELEKETSEQGAAEQAIQTKPESSPAENTSPSHEPQKTPKKSVVFAEDTKPGHDAVASPFPSAAQQLEKIMESARQQEALDLSKAVIPENESAEDTALRRQMLEYGMSDIGPVVAELQLEEDDEPEEDDMSWENSDEEADEDDDDDGSLFRPSKHSVITNDYVKRMQELEKKLGVKSAFTAQPGRQTTELPEEGIGKISVVPPQQSDKPASKEKKSVKFAPQLDIAEDDVSTATPAPASSEPFVNPVGEIVEHEAGASHSAKADTTNKRMSRFKRERMSNTVPQGQPNSTLPPGPHQLPTRFLNGASTELPPVPSGPEGTTIAPTVVERAGSSTPREPDEFDDALLYQAAAAEYNKLRNRAIQRQGGFNKPEESLIVPLDEEEGGPKRVSRFKAARLANRS